MVLSVSDRIFETSSTTGTGTLNLSGAVSGFRSFVSGVGSGKKVPYIIDDGAGGNWEVGVGTVTSGTPDTLSRDYVVSSSNSNALVNWGAGTRNIRLGVTSKAWAVRDENFNFIDGHSQNTAGTASAQTITVDPAPRAYSDGMVVSWFSVGATTGAVTVNVNSLGAKTLKWKGSDLVSGDFASGDLIVAKYKASTGFFELITPPNNSTIDGTITYSKIVSSAFSILSDLVSGTASKLVNAAIFKSYMDTYIFGKGQTWQDVSASRVIGTTYTNSTGRPIMVNASFVFTDDGVNLEVGGIVACSCDTGSGTGVLRVPMSVVVPDGATYRAVAARGAAAINTWAELR